jgi:diaminohydroxyphosphoribosylaminopyrimidine deaminase/5-amino-6-(5-phosphoribosylamino)uracil reductase
VAIADAGVARVVVATEDPNPLVAGRGLAYLRQRRIEVVTGLRADEASRLNVAFFTAMRKGRPWVVLKVATSLDGAVAAAQGRRTPLTSREASRVVHRFRAEVDAIGVGSETLLVDDPLLTVRGVFRHRPLLRVVFDSRLRTPPSARVLTTLDAGPVIVATTVEACAADPAAADALRRAGAELLMVPARDIGAVLRALWARDVRSIVVEGGPTLHRAAWAARVVDRVQLFVTPTPLGRGAVPWGMPPECSPAAWPGVRVRPLGPDVLMEAECSLD